MTLDEVKSGVANLGPSEGLKWIAEHFGSRARFSTSLGLEDQVISYWIGTQKLPVEVFSLDTGRLFQETYDVLALTRTKYNLPIKVYYPDATQVEQLVLAKGPNSFYDSVENRKECCSIRKVGPLKRALTGAAVWITGIRADQSANRQAMDLVEWDDVHQLIKYNPILHWSFEDVEKFIKDNNVPVNSLHKKGFPSIGCAPCTRAIAPGEDIRAGRWWWETSAK
ncbi:MAG TPA: phosphoadenylyl-sulfate reductase, partial [Cyclobacteriaceae bacterium]|nr:phosphoadenylyl-sulfate reductase [Cyclobacteriaceae bacterium]